VRTIVHNSNSNKGIVKFDWNINDNNKLAVIYNFLDASKDKPAHPSALGFRGPNASILQFEKSGYQINNKLDSFLAELNSKFSETVSNKLQVGYTHFNDFRNPFLPCRSLIFKTERVQIILLLMNLFS
jgi:hypothetical protein